MILSNAPLFIDKLEFIEDSIFVMGCDTLIRIVDQKYYKEDNDLYKILSKFEEKNCLFEVFPRYDPILEKVIGLQ